MAFAIKNPVMGRLALGDYPWRPCIFRSGIDNGKAFWAWDGHRSHGPFNSLETADIQLSIYLTGRKVKRTEAIIVFFACLAIVTAIGLAVHLHLFTK